MKTILFASACLILVSGPALACRGTTEYPDTAKKIEQSTLSPELREDLLRQLNRGDVMHKEAHRTRDMAHRYPASRAPLPLHLCFADSTPSS